MSTAVETSHEHNVLYGFYAMSRQARHDDGFSSYLSSTLWAQIFVFLLLMTDFHKSYITRNIQINQNNPNH